MERAQEIQLHLAVLHVRLHISQRVHVGIWYIFKAQRGSHIPTLRPKYLPYTYMDPLGLCQDIVLREAALARAASQRRLRVPARHVSRTWFKRSLQGQGTNAAGAGKLDYQGNSVGNCQLLHICLTSLSYRHSETTTLPDRPQEREIINLKLIIIAR